MNRFKQFIASLLLSIIVFSGGSAGVSNLLNTPNVAHAAAKAKKDYVVYITNTGEKYHRAGCRYLRKSQIAIKKSEAINEGYEPCKVCKP